MSRVFVVQNQHHFDNRTSQLVPKFNFETAYAYGDLKFLLSPTAAPFQLDGIIQQLHENLADFSEDDYLLLVGNPVLIGITVAIAADSTGGNVKMLQWNGKEQRYLPIEARGIFIDSDAQFSS